MIKATFCLLLATLLTIIHSGALAQQNQSTQKPNPEIETLEKRILALENQLQTVENVEKMKLAAELADAQAKLRNAEIGKYRRELKDSNDEWLREWSLWFAGILGLLVLVIGGAFWFWLRYRADQLITNEVEKSLNGFKEAIDQVDTLKNELKEAVGQVNILQDQIRILRKEHAASVLEDFMWYRFSYENPYPEQMNVLSEIALLDVFNDKMYYLHLRCRAAEVLTHRGSTRLTIPMLEFLNTSVDSDLYDDVVFQTGRKPDSRARQLFSLINFLSAIHTQETYEGLKTFLNRLLTENLKRKDLFLTWTVFSLASVSIELNRKDSISIIRKTIPDLVIFSYYEQQALKNLATYFDSFNEPEGIKEILAYPSTNERLDCEDYCLELLQKHDPEFVEKWKAEKETSETQNEESS